MSGDGDGVGLDAEPTLDALKRGSIGRDRAKDIGAQDHLVLPSLLYPLGWKQDRPRLVSEHVGCVLGFYDVAK